MERRGNHRSSRRCHVVGGRRAFRLSRSKRHHGHIEYRAAGAAVPELFPYYHRGTLINCYYYTVRMFMTFAYFFF